MRILALAAEPPYPPNHGVRLRSWHLLSRMARTDHVTMITWSAAGEDDDAVTATRQALQEVVVLPRRTTSYSAVARAARLARFVAGGPPAYVQAMLEERAAPPGAEENLARVITALHNEAPFDVVIAEEEAMAWLPLPPLGIPLVVHRLNVFARVLADVRQGNRRDQLIGLFDTRAWRRFDIQTSVNAARQLATTAESAGDLVALTGLVPTTVITNGVAMPPAMQQPAHHDSPTDNDVAFIGWMGYPANADAVVWFARNVWPIVHAQHPTSRFRIVGREPTEEVQRLAGNSIVVTGEVADVAAACAGVKVGVAPLLAGMGIKNKTLELMAMEIPVVALPRGSEGIAASEHDGLITVRDAGSMAQAVCGLLADPTRARTLGAAGRAYVLARHSWDAIAADYRDVIAGVVAEHQLVGAVAEGTR